MPKDIRDAFFDMLYEDALKDKDIIVITADADAFGLRQFKKNISDRFINIGVTEQNMINVAAGMAMRNKKVFVYGIIPFITMRCYEQIKFNLSGMNLPVKIVGVGTGFSFGFDGPSHHGINDIAIMRSVPNMQIFNPCDETSTVASYKLMKLSDSPSYIRLDKGKYEDIYTNDAVSKIPEDKIILLKAYTEKNEFKTYKFLTDNDVGKILVISTGYATHIVKKYIETSQSNIDDISFMDIYQIKTFPYENLDMYEHIIVIEEHCKTGGLYNIVLEKAASNINKPNVHSISLMDAEHLIYGDRKFLLEKNGITVKNLAKNIDKCRI